MSFIKFLKHVGITKFGEFKPFYTFNLVSNTLTIYTEDCSYSERYVSDLVTTIHDAHNIDKVVGLVIYGFYSHPLPRELSTLDIPGELAKEIRNLWIKTYIPKSPSKGICVDFNKSIDAFIAPLEETKTLSVLEKLNEIIKADTKITQEELNWIVQEFKKKHYKGASTAYVERDR